MRNAKHNNRTSPAMLVLTAALSAFTTPLQAQTKTCTPFATAAGVQSVGSDVWVVLAGTINDGTVEEINGACTVLHDFTAGSAGNTLTGAIAADSKGHVYITGSNGSTSPGTVSKVTAGVGVLWTSPVGKDPFGVYADADGDLWVANQTSLTVTKLSQSSGKVLKTLSAQGHTPRAFAFDTVHQTVWALCTDNAVVIFNLNGSLNQVVTLTGASFGGNTSIAFDGTASMWIASSSTNALNQVDLAGNFLQTVSLGTGANPQQVVWDPTTSSLLTALFGTSTIAQVNPTSGTVTNSFAVGSGPLSVTSMTSYIFSANNSAGTVTRVKQP